MKVQDLLKHVVGTRLAFTWWGERRKVEDSVKRTMANAVAADPDSLTAGKRLYNTRLEANGGNPLLEIQSTKTEIREHWERQTMLYPEPGVRLLPRENLLPFDNAMQAFQVRLSDEATKVQRARQAIIDEARQRLGDAFDPGNYPADLSRLFGFEISYPSLHAPNDLPPQLFEAEKKRVEQRLNEALKQTTDAFTQEFAQMVNHLHERLTPAADGQAKVFRNSAIENLLDFFERFKTLNFGGMEDLDTIVQQAQELVKGLTPKELRQSAGLRTEIAQGLAQVETAIAPLIVNRPRRSILRPGANGQQPSTNGTPIQEPIPA
jgi:hypothetical protein